MSLQADGEATILRYDVEADVGGKLAQLGGRLIEGTAKKLAGDFFNSFSEAVAGPAEEAAPAAQEPAESEGVSPWVWIGVGAVALVVLYILIGVI